MNEELKSKIGVLMGEVTMAWNPIPDGVFDSEHASDVLERFYSLVGEALDDRYSKGWDDGREYGITDCKKCACQVCYKSIERM